MRILYMGPLLPFRGGSGVVGSMLVRALTQQGCAVAAASFLSERADGLDPGLAGIATCLREVRVPRDANPWDAPDVAYVMHANMRLSSTAREIADAWTPNALLVGRGDYAMAAMQLATDLRLPLAIIDHGSASARYAGLAGVAEAFRPEDVLRRATCIISVAPHRAELLRKNGFTRVVTIPNGVDTALFRPDGHDDAVRAALGIDGSVGLVAHVSNLSPVKRVPDLLQAAKLLCDAEADAHFLVVGDGPSRNELIAMTRKIGIEDRVTFTGWLEAEELARLLRCIDILVQPSQSEACPLAVLEAMASGCAVIASDIAGHREIIERDVSGVFTPMGDTAALKTEIASLLGSPTQRQALGAAARAAVRSHTLQAMGRSYHQALSDMVAGFVSDR